ncbi:hypothetical protein ANN_11315 [Periplaneta americana]|uniref:Uncharacterized protein n=1 Tax=Periplaneta americana TaxID=6978 RepID=A0ABQ8T4N6_PERAM|nr:hypothetical protein ANN_11315 [Periplaneta americana]
MAARSIPNLEDHLHHCTTTVPVKSKEVTSKNLKSRKPVNLCVYASDGTVNMAARSTPNLEDLLRHSSLTNVPLKSEEPAAIPPTGKGVHFCPVVAEVSWRDSYSDDEPQEEMERALYALERGEDVTVPSLTPLTLQKIQVGVPAGPGSAERERVVVDLQQEVTRSHVVSAASDGSAGAPKASAVSSESMETKQRAGDSSGKKTGGRFGGFFQRFSLRRLSGNGSSKKQKEDKKRAAAATPSAVEKPDAAEYEDVTIIPLHPPPDEVVSSKPPLPPPSPRRRPGTGTDAQSASDAGIVRERADMSCIDPPPGLLETDLDTHVSTVRPIQNGAAPSSKKARSLLNLGDIQQQQQQQQHVAAMLLKPPPGGGGATNRPITPADSRAKSMEFLLDKENQAAVQVTAPRM